jgi:propanol-preferring alcohol dehydrogenase
MAVGLPAKANLEASIFFTVFKSITIHGSYVGNRQDAIECVGIAATGAVKVHYQLKPMDELEKYVFLVVINLVDGKMIC